jgi:pimeloyl-ACP methyl ester carboxylesterase
VSVPAVIVVHGLWMTGIECAMLRRRLAALGFAPRQFHYHSVSESALTVLARLRAEVEACAAEGPVHLVGHSLGGLLVLRLLSAPPALPVGRAVLLGSPVRGSRAARTLNELPGANWLLGDLAEAELVQTMDRAWQGPGELGVIAGTSGIGLGRLFNHFAEANDGTVTLSETELPGATDRCVLPVSHLGMLLSDDVADEVAHFLDQGRFSAAQR